MWAHPYQTWWGPSTHLWDRLTLGVWGRAGKLWIHITSAVWQLATRCLILWVVFGVKLSNENTVEIEGLRDVATATNFGTALAANGLWREITTWCFRINGLFSVTPASVGRSLWNRNCGDRNCSRRATVPLGINTLIANIRVFLFFLARPLGLRSAISLHTGRSWARSTASFSRPSYRTGRCSATWYEDALVVSSIYLVGEPLESSRHLRHHPVCPNIERRRNWIIAVRLGCLVIILISSLQTNWCHLNDLEWP